MQSIPRLLIDFMFDVLHSWYPRKLEATKVGNFLDLVGGLVVTVKNADDATYALLDQLNVIVTDANSSRASKMPCRLGLEILDHDT